MIQAETGSGKTLAFLLPAMVLPTRALTRVVCFGRFCVLRRGRNSEIETLINML